MGENIECGSGLGVTDCKEFFNEYFLKNLKIAKSCNNKGYEKGCLPNYSQEDFPGITSCPYYRYDFITIHHPAYQLQNGAIIFPYNDSNVYYALFGFDINGKKGPNKPGYDVFSVGIENANKIPKISTKTILNCLPTTNAKFKNFSDIMK